MYEYYDLGSTQLLSKYFGGNNSIGKKPLTGFEGYLHQQPWHSTEHQELLSAVPPLDTLSGSSLFQKSQLVHLKRNRKQKISVPFIHLQHDDSLLADQSPFHVC